MSHTNRNKNIFLQFLHVATARPVWPNDWVFVYELSGCGFESSCSHLIIHYTSVLHIFSSARSALGKSGCEIFSIFVVRIFFIYYKIKEENNTYIENILWLFPKKLIFMPIDRNKNYIHSFSENIHVLDKLSILGPKIMCCYNSASVVRIFF